MSIDNEQIDLTESWTATYEYQSLAQQMRTGRAIIRDLNGNFVGTVDESVAAVMRSLPEILQLARMVASGNVEFDDLEKIAFCIMNCLQIPIGSRSAPAT